MLKKRTHVYPIGELEMTKPIASMFGVALASLTLVTPPAGAAALGDQVQLSQSAWSDEVSSHRKRHRRVRVYAKYRIYDGPRACEAVVFPKSHLCYEPATLFGLPLPGLWVPR